MESLNKIAQIAFESEIEFEQNPKETSIYKYLKNKLELVSPDQSFPFDENAFEQALKEVYFKDEIQRNLSDLNTGQINQIIEYFGIFADTTFYTDDDYLIDNVYDKECLSVLNTNQMLASFLHLIYKKYVSLIGITLSLNMTREEWIECVGFSFTESDMIDSCLLNIKNNLNIVI